MRLYDVTLKILVSLVVGLILYDLVAEIWCGNECTESAWVFRLAWQLPQIPFLSGILCGHFFFERREPSPEGVEVSWFIEWGKIGILLASAVWFALDLIWPVSRLTANIDHVPMHGIPELFVIGVLLGFIFCQMNGPTSKENQ